MNSRNPIIILGIESSCDETSAAVTQDCKVLANLIAGQKIHELYGGVVPELASRAHQKNIVPVVDQALKDAGIKKEDLTAIAFTRGPGLIGSLLVGASFSKAMALALNIPLIEVNHMQAHVLAHFCLPPTPSFRGGSVSPKPSPLKKTSTSNKQPLFRADPMLYKLLKEFAETHRNVPTEAEKILWLHLRGKKMDGYKFRQQHIIGQYIADFFCHSYSLVIEIDGLIHNLPDIKENDETRTKWLNEHGYEVIRLTNNEVIGNIDGTLEKIKEKIESLTQVSPEGGDLEGASPSFPFLCLTVSGGHTQIVLAKDYLDMEVIGETTDDAAGEAFDKAAKILGLPYPGGPLIDKYAQNGNPNAFKFPVPNIPGLNFSFSGVKTSFLYFIRDNLKKDPAFIEKNMNDICASIQHTIVKILMDKLVLAVQTLPLKGGAGGGHCVAIAGGVSANSGLRKAITETGKQLGWKTFIPPFEYCTDNAAMIAIAGYFKYLKREFAEQSVAASARYKI